MGNVGPEELRFAERRLPVGRLAVPGPGQAHLWLVDLVTMGSPLQPDEAIDRDHFPARQQRTIRRFYLRLLLGAYLGLPGKDVHLVRSERGKPVLDRARHDVELNFSLAASSGYCLIGLTSRCPIGVDLEPVGRRAGKPLTLARRYFSAAEYRGLGELDADRLDEAFLHTWACKEAVVKAGGTGIANALCRFTVSVRPEEPATLLAMDDDDAQAWTLRTVSVPGGLFGAVTVRFPRLELDGFRLAPPA